LNHDGKINDGRELFGEGFDLPNGQKAPDGFTALATLDSNADGIINAADQHFNELLVWTDANSNGLSDAGELKSLADLGIATLNLHAKTSTAEDNGNALGLVSDFTKTDGTQADLVDVWLATGADPVATQASTAAVVAEPATSTTVATAAPAISVDSWLDSTHGNGWFNITGSTFADGTTTANEIKLTMSDLLKLPADTHGLLTAHVTGDANDTLNLSNLFDNGLAAQGNWSASGSVAQDGVNYTAYTFSGNAQLQVLVDQHIQHVNMA
jgi:hypothetical protein